MTIAEANEPLSNGLKIIIAQKGLKICMLQKMLVIHHRN